MYKNFKMKNPFSRNMFGRSNMDYSLDDLTSDGVNESVLNVQDREHLGQKYVHNVKHGPLSV